MNINNKEVSLRFGMLSVEIFLGEADKNNGLSYYSSLQMAKIIYAGMINYYEVKQLPYPVTFEEIYDYVESKMMAKDDVDELVKVIEDFNNCQAIKKKAEDVKAAVEEIEEVKKKELIGTTQELQHTQQD
jgi:hypothetical protein